MKNLRPRHWLGVCATLASAVLLFALTGGAAMLRPASRFAALGPSGAGGGAISAAPALGSAVSGPEVVVALHHDLSAPLRSITPVELPKDAVDPDLNRLFTLPGRDTGGTKSPAVGFRDPVLQAAPGGGNIPSPVVSFDGVSNLFGGWPPDTNGDVGPNHYVQWINLSLQVWDKNGVSLLGPIAGNTIWSGFGGLCQTDNDGDPIVLYDQLADRWMISQFALGFPSNFHQCIAVSQTGDPTGAWHRYDFLWGTKLNDYPHFGVWPDGYYMAVNQFHGSTFAWQGQGVAVFERSQMLVGGVARMVKFDLFTTDANLGGMLPSDWDGVTQPGAGEPNHFSEVDDDGTSTFPDQLQLWDFHVDWVNTALSTFTHILDLPVAAFDSQFACGGNGRSCIPQPSTSARLDAISDRLMHRLQYRNFGAYQTLVANHTVDVDTTSHAGVRWYELRNSGAGWSIFQQGTYAPDSGHRWMGSIAMNGQGEIALGFSNSSSAVFPSVRYTGRVAGDALNTLPQGEGTIIAGTGSQTDLSFNRWGDYSAMTVDPVDDCTFWYTQEYVQTTGSATWKTRIGSFRVTTCGGGPTPPPTAAGPTPTSTFTPTPTLTPTPTPTPSGCVSNCLRVSAITVQSTATGVRARVTIRNEANVAVSGAIVFVTWNLPGGGTQMQSSTTNAQGRVQFNVTGGSGTYTITVTNVTKAGSTFDPGGSTLLSQSFTKP